MRTCCPPSCCVLLCWPRALLLHAAPAAVAGSHPVLASGVLVATAAAVAVVAVLQGRQVPAAGCAAAETCQLQLHDWHKELAAMSLYQHHCWQGLLCQQQARRVGGVLLLLQQLLVGLMPGRGLVGIQHGTCQWMLQFAAALGARMLADSTQTSESKLDQILMLLAPYDARE